jgi:hypothetical protein
LVGRYGERASSGRLVDLLVDRQVFVVDDGALAGSGSKRWAPWGIPAVQVLENAVKKV